MRAAAATLALAALLGSAAAAPPALAKHFAASSNAGLLCANVCQESGRKAALFANQNVTTALCAVDAGGSEGWVPGWQLVGEAGGDATCSTAANGVTTASSTYACMCLGAGMTQGIDNPSGKPCRLACSKSILGTVGAPIQAGDGPNAAYACLSLPSELGMLNR